MSGVKNSPFSRWWCGVSNTYVRYNEKKSSIVLGDGRKEEVSPFHAVSGVIFFGRWLQLRHRHTLYPSRDLECMCVVYIFSSNIELLYYYEAARKRIHSFILRHVACHVLISEYIIHVQVGRSSKLVNLIFKSGEEKEKAQKRVGSPTYKLQRNHHFPPMPMQCLAMQVSE